MLKRRLYKFPWKIAFELNYIQREEKPNLFKRLEQRKNNTIVFKRKKFNKELHKGVFEIRKAEIQSCVTKARYPKLLTIKLQ